MAGGGDPPAAGGQGPFREARYVSAGWAVATRADAPMMTSGGVYADGMARIIVVCGLPGCGKTTLASALAAELSAAYLRVDVIETPLILAGIDVGPLGYQIVHELAASNLALGADVVVDLVNPLPETRRLWGDLAAQTDSALVVFECVVPDREEHRRRVEARRPDLPGQSLPSWAEVTGRDYVPWDEERDGPRTIVDMTHTADGVATARRELPPSG